MDISIEVGTIYAFSDHYLRMLYAKDNQVMLEKWAEGGIQGYSVVTGPYMHEGKLAWLNGWHLPCRDNTPPYDTPFEAFEKARKYMQGAVYVHALIADTKYGPSVTLYNTRQLAMQALQRELDGNKDIQSLAEFRGIAPLTAEAYMQGVLSDAPLPVDEYTARTRVVNESMPEIQEVDDDE